MPAKPIDPVLARLLESHRFQRSFWVLIVLMIYDPQPVGRDLLAAHTAISKPTAAQYLDDLARLELIIRQGLRDGYVLTNAGRQLVMGFATPQQIPAIAGQPDVLELEAEKDESQNFLPSPLKKERDINLINLDSFLPSSEAPESKVLTLLEQTGILFNGQTVNASGLPIERLTETIVLGYLAHAMRQKRLTAPAAFVYRRLQAFGTRSWQNPNAECLRDYASILPQNYLAAVGLLTFKCEICEQEFGSDEAAFGKHIRNQHPDTEQDEIVADIDGCLADETVTPKIDQAWQSVLGQLEMEMPKASFDTWVRDTAPVHFANGTLNVGCRNTYNRDWLESRLASTVARMMVGILNAHVAVNFVVANVAVETEGSL